MIDFHAHILPGADHGSDGLQTSLQQLKLAEQAGIDTLIATPHFYPQVEELDEFLNRRAQCWDKLQQAYHGPVQLLLGAEVHMCPGLDHLEGLEQLCVQDTNSLLLELGFGSWSKEVERTVIRIQEDGIFHPVLAHIDRYDPKAIDRILSFDVDAQLNADAFSRLFGKKKLISWIDEGAVVALGSDIHGTTIGYKNYFKTKKYLGERFDIIMQRTEQLLSQKIDTV